ncbi:MAG: hypothetical protein BMS9Abin07_0127 [Acidimicrobiia bacterium]|nr:MAG: hypothetical protein BMS9Abin07_0127 [Acidimicrobiia bacterium]
MSVDTNTMGKNLDPYRRVQRDDVEFLVPRNLTRWADNLTVHAKKTMLGTRFIVEAGHAHAPGCQHG